MATAGWTEGIVAGLISSAVALIFSLLSGVAWVGYHKRRHEDDDKARGELTLRLAALQESHNARSVSCPITLVKARQDIVLDNVDAFRDELKDVASKVDRILGYLEAKNGTHLK